MGAVEVDKEVLFENTAGTAVIIHYPEKKCLEIALIGAPKEDDYKEAFTRFAHILGELQYHQVLFNNLRLEKDTLIERAWFLAKFLPMAYRNVTSDRYKAAVVAPANPIQKMATAMVARSAKSLGKPVAVEFFNEQSKALDWM